MKPATFLISSLPGLALEAADLPGVSLNLARAILEPEPLALPELEYDICTNNCRLNGVPVPDKNTFALPLENFADQSCPPFYIGSNLTHPVASGRVCMDFVGPNWVFNFSAVPGYTYNRDYVSVGWKIKGRALDPETWTLPPPPINSLSCTVNPLDTYGLTCSLPFYELFKVPQYMPLQSLLNLMCPSDDREGIIVYLQFSGSIYETATATTRTFQQKPPCVAWDTFRQCIAWDTSFQYIEVSYKCTKCDAPTCPPKTCRYGTAFGYQPPVDGVVKSLLLNEQSGQGCQRWGWYELPTLAELQAGISGTLYVGEGGNDLTRGINVGTWTASATPTGGVTVTYALTRQDLTLDEVHVDVACGPIDSCVPSQYTFSSGDVLDATTYSNPRPLQYPVCTGQSRATLIVQAAVNTFVSSREQYSCPKAQ
ncbi:hypothetical protein QBC35DRAFT_452106 [Podospora australis]|uniref:Uncharacterized protein n=1 Tax=Podospora australis TaxID=1536484 RepID=A0AAN7AHM3_9PEZI|nr:hypothetical protein QBC35DRAFT_452106 [Podospora australis]